MPRASVTSSCPHLCVDASNCISSSGSSPAQIASAVPGRHRCNPLLPARDRDCRLEHSVQPHATLGDYIVSVETGCFQRPFRRTIKRMAQIFFDGTNVSDAKIKKWGHPAW